MASGAREPDPGFPVVRILGLPLFNGKAEEAVDRMVEHGGLMTVPSAPCMILASRDRAFHDAMRSSRLILADSGYMTLVWRLRGGRRINRISGYEFLEYFLEKEVLREPGSLFRVEPSEAEAESNARFLSEKGIPQSSSDAHIAPFYNRAKIEDPALLEVLLERRPRAVLINLGGGVQEHLGSYLQREWKKRLGPDVPVPALLCTGGAITFFTGSRVRIPRWADRLFLGWLLRTLHDPKAFIPRFMRSFVLALIVFRWGTRSPLDLAD